MLTSGQNQTTTPETNPQNQQIGIETQPMTKPSEASSLSQRPRYAKNAPEAVAALTNLGDLLKSDQDLQWRIGDAVWFLTESCGYTIKELAQRYNYSPNRLSDIKNTCKVFADEKDRHYDLPFFDHELVRAAVTKFPDMKLAPKQLVETVQQFPQMQIEGTKDKNGNPKMGLRKDMRGVARYVSTLRQKMEDEASAAQAPLRLAKGGELIDACHHKSFQQMVPELVSKNIKFGLIFADPPYAQYTKVASGEYVHVGVGRGDCDCSTQADAIAVTLDLIKATPSLLETNGCLVLCQAAGELRLPIHQAILDNGLEIYREVIWDKNKYQPGNFDGPWTTRTERLWIIKRKGEVLRNHSLSERSDIINFKAVPQDADDPLATHIFMKPLDLCEFIIAKHTMAEGFVFDPFGCSGNQSISAIRLGRHFVYCESNAANFEWGSKRVYEALAATQQNAA